MKRTLLLFGVLAATLITYLLWRPIINYGITRSLNINIYTWTDARNYYTVLSSISSVAIGWIGIIIGYFYYQNRKKHDATVLFNNKIENRIESIFKRLNDIGKLVDDVLDLRISSPSELARARSEISCHFDDIIILIENNEKLLGHNSTEIKKILSYYSHIEQSLHIMQMDYDSLGKCYLLEHRTLAQERLRSAKETCILSLPGVQ